MSHGTIIQFYTSKVKQIWNDLLTNFGQANMCERPQSNFFGQERELTCDQKDLVWFHRLLSQQHPSSAAGSWIWFIKYKEK